MTQSDPSPEVLSILVELQAHLEWPQHVRVAHDGNVLVAQDSIAAKWQETQEVSGYTISVEEFVYFYKSFILDVLIKQDDIEPGDIVAELQLHPEWDTHVHVAYDGDFLAAEDNIAAKWQEAQEASGHTISASSFVYFYRSQILDGLIKRDDYEPGDLGEYRRP